MSHDFLILIRITAGRRYNGNDYVFCLGVFSLFMRVLADGFNCILSRHYFFLRLTFLTFSPAFGSPQAGKDYLFQLFCFLAFFQFVWQRSRLLL
jgi:hypothetical protein